MIFYHELNPDVFWYLLASAIVLANGCFVGSWLLTRMVDPGNAVTPAIDLLEWLFLATTLGLGLIACVTLPLGLILPYSPWLYRAAHGGVMVAGIAWWRWAPAAAQIRNLPAMTWRDLPGLERFLWVLVGLTFGYAGFLALHAIEGSDGQTLHLKAVMLWQESHSYMPQVSLFDGLPHTVGDEQTQSGRLLLLNVALLGSVFATGVFNTLLLVLGCLGTYVLGCRLFERRVALFGVLILLTNPVIFRYYLWDVTDYTLNLAVFLALAASLTMGIGGGRGWLRVAAVLGGVLFGLKSYALLQLPLVAAISFPFLYRRKLLGAAVRESPWFAVFVAPWVVHNWWLYGNPIWPHLNGLFHGRSFNPLFHLWAGTRPYTQIARYLDAGASTYGAALVQFWRGQLFPAQPYYDFAFSPVLVPSILVFAVAAFWRRIFLVPLVFAAGFLAVTLNTPQLFNKYMVLIAAPTAPFLAAIVFAVAGRWRVIQTALAVTVGAAGLWVAWDAVAFFNRQGELLSYSSRVRSAQPQATLNKLPSTALVFGNFVGMDNRYTRIYWKFRNVSDTSELLCDDWTKLWEFYRSMGVTHYLVHTREADVYGYDSALPYVLRFDPLLAKYIKDRQVIFSENKAKRDRYLSEHGKQTDLGGGYLLYELH